MAKQDAINAFSSKKIAVVLCNMALGLGQNWKRFCMVAHVGQGDPESLFQMIGRCG
jgi:superfamily II DNA helicase RecQ